MITSLVVLCPVFVYLTEYNVPIFYSLPTVSLSVLFTVIKIMAEPEVKKPSYKYCMVPECKNTTFSTPNKKFFRIPRDAKLRKQWCKIIKKDNVSPLSVVFCCEDHFNIKEDTANYVKYNIMKHERDKCSLRLKKGVVPHIFLREGLAHVNEALAGYAIKSGSNLVNGEPPEIIDDKVSTGPVAGPSARSETTCHDVVRPHTGLVTLPQVVSSKTSDSRSLLVGHHLKEQVREPSRSLMTSQREKSERNIRLPEAKEIITSVYHYLQTEYEYLKSYISSDCDLTPLGNILQRTAEATGVSEQTVTALLGEGKHTLESTHETVQRKHSNSSQYSSFEDDNVSDEQYTSRVETFQVEIEEYEDQRTDVNDKTWVKVEATPSESTFASRSLLSTPHHVKVEPFDFEYEQTGSAVHSAAASEHVVIKQEPSDIEYCQQNEQGSDGLERLKMEFEEEKDEDHGNDVRRRSNVEATTSDTLHSSEWSQNIVTETGHSQKQLNTIPTRDIIKKSKNKARQQRYRERNREKLKKSEAERRKRIRCLQNTAELSSSSINRIEESYKELIDANSQSSSGLEDPETTSLLKAKYALERRREVQRRYREKNREKLKQREAERRQRLLTDRDSSGPRTNSTVHLALPSDVVDIKEESSDINEYCESTSAEPRVPPDAVHDPVKTEPLE